MSLSRKAKALGYGATGGYLFYLGVFTIIGAFVVMLCPIGWALAAVFFAAVIEGTVYAKNIFKGIENSNTEFALKHALAIKKLKELKENHSDNLFIKTYDEIKTHLHNLRESHKHDADTEAQIEDTAKFLIHLEDLVIKCRSNLEVKGKDPIEQQLINYLKPLIDKADEEEFNRTISNRSPYMLISKIMSFLSGSFSAISAAAVIHGYIISPFGLGVLAQIGISTALATGIIVPLMAVLVLIGSGLVMYGTASEIIKQGGADSWFVKIEEFLDLNVPCNSCWKFFKKSAFYILVGGLIIFSTVATIYSFFAPIISTPTKLMLTTFLMALVIACAIVSFALTLIFNIENALDSLQRIKETVVGSWKTIQENWQNSASCFNFITKFETFENDTTWSQIFNPFRLVSHIFLAAHAYCIGISADNFPCIPPVIVSWLSALMEWVSDFHYVSPKKSKKNFPNKTELTMANKDISLEEKLENVPITENNKKEDEDHDHEHGSLLELALMPFNALAVVWDYFAGKKNQTWQNSKDKFFPPAKGLPSSTPLIPLEFTQYHLNLELDEQIIKYRKQAINESGEYDIGLDKVILTLDEKSLPAKKANAFKQLKKTININASLGKEKFSSCLEEEYAKYEEYKSVVAPAKTSPQSTRLNTSSNEVSVTVERDSSAGTANKYKKHEDSDSDLPLAQHQNSIRFFKSRPPDSFQNARAILDAAKRSLAYAPNGG